MPMTDYDFKSPNAKYDHFIAQYFGNRCENKGMF